VAANFASRAVKPSSKLRAVVVVTGVVLLLFLLRPGASRLKARIAGSISAAVARPVEIGSVHIRLLPRPGFDLENLVVYDDPAFGAEPMLRAGQVTADLRLTSLVRGRLELARLDLTEPSLNLVRGANGRWNLGALLQRSAQTTLAPTAKAKSEPRPAFPYIEGSSARINLKIGQEKKPYALTNADFSFWQDSENAWGVRLKAQPLRSDLSLSDTGTLRVNGTWQRATDLRETPLQFSLEWDGPQLGQLTKFLTGSDKGWRGALQLNATLSGTPAQLQVSSDASIRDFRRYDISSGESLLLAAHCDGQYSSLDHAVHELFCRGPVGNGAVTLHGDMGFPGSHEYDLMLMAENVPASALVAVVQRAKKNMPADLTATGDVEGSLSIRENGASAQGAQILGSGEIAKLHLKSASNKVELDLDSIPLVLASAESVEIASLEKKLFSSTSARSGAESFTGPFLEFGPFPLGIGRGLQPTAQGWLGRSGYRVSLTGEAEVARALRVARLFGLSALSTAAEGVAQVDLQIAGSWTEWATGAPSTFAEPQVTGTAKLHNVRVEVRGADGPIEIASANLQLLPDVVRVAKLNANAAHALWTGSLELPRGCGTPGACAVRFNLGANEVGLSEVSQWVSPGPKERPWYKVLSPGTQAGPSFLASLRASGKVYANRLLVRNLVATHVSASLNLDSRKLRISELRGDLLGGKQRSDWQVDFSVKPPVYSGSGTVTEISLGHLAATKDEWIAGTANGSYQLTASGSTADEFWQSAKGTVQFDMRDGILPYISIGEDAGPLKVGRFEGSARLRDAKLELEEGQLDSQEGLFGVSGTASLGRELHLKLTRSSAMNAAGPTPPGYTITGTITEPRVVPWSNLETRAQLKP
jgi:hypothetical protein